MDLVGFVGFQNSGKNTAALPLEEFGYTPISFADSLKDCLSAIFQWPREMLEGTTPESRAWREQVDPWWAKRLGIPDFTPRMAMQRVGTEALRHHFHQDIWVSSVEKKLDAGGKFVFTDLRYPNEINLIISRGGKVIRIRKGPEPEWYDLAKRLNLNSQSREAKSILMENMYPDVHETEYAWIGSPMETIENDSTIEVLHQRVLAIVFGTSPQDAVAPQRILHNAAARTIRGHTRQHVSEAEERSSETDTCASYPLVPEHRPDQQ